MPNEILVAAILLHFHGIMDEIQVLAVGPAQLQAVVIGLNALEPRRFGRQRSSAEFECCRVRTHADGVGGLNANSENTHTQGENATLERKREKRTKGVAHLLIQRTNL